jgi:hypothetical protein
MVEITLHLRHKSQIQRNEQPGMAIIPHIQSTCGKNNRILTNYNCKSIHLTKNSISMFKSVKDGT